MVSSEPSLGSHPREPTRRNGEEGNPQGGFSTGPMWKPPTPLGPLGKLIAHASRSARSGGGRSVLFCGASASPQETLFKRPKEHVFPNTQESHFGLLSFDFLELVRCENFPCLSTCFLSLAFIVQICQQVFRSPKVEHSFSASCDDFGPTELADPTWGTGLKLTPKPPDPNRRSYPNFMKNPKNMCLVRTHFRLRKVSQLL